MGKPSVTVIVSGPNEGTNSIYNTVVLKNRYPFAQQVTLPNTKYVVKYNFDLGLETMEMPSGCMLDFDGGSIYNGTIIGDDTVEINHSGVNVWGENLTKGGTWLLQHGGNVPADWSQEDPDAPDFINNKPNLATVATSGSYEDLSNTPNLADVATSGSYGDLINKPHIPNDQVLADWNQSNTDSPDYIKNKPTVPNAANNGTFSIKTKIGSNSAVTAADFTANQSSADDITLIQGNNITLTTDTTNRTITIDAKDTTYNEASTSTAGLMSASDKTKLNSIETGATKVESSATNGNIKINGTDITVYTHPGSGTNPHGTTKSDVGLGNVGNFKAVSTEASQGLNSTEQSNARANIGAGTSSFSGNYDDLSNKPSIPAAAGNGTFSVKTKVGSNDAVTAADFTANLSSADDITLIQGSNITLTTDTANRTVTIAATDTTYDAATTSAAGLMSAEDKVKLNGIAANAQAHIAPTSQEVKSALGTGNGTTKYLREDGTWATPPVGQGADGNTTYKFTIGSTTKGDVSGEDLGTLKSETAASGGSTLSLVTTGEKHTWNNKQDSITFNTAYNASSNKAATMSDIPTTMGASGSNHKSGLVPDPGSTAGTSKYLREDGTWAAPASQVLADWNQTNTSSTDYIKNKPDLSNIGVESIATVNINDTTGEGSSYTQASFGTKYYVTSLSTDEFAENTFIIPDPASNVGKSIDVYTYFKEENGKDNVPLKIVCNTANVDIIRVDNGTADDESFLLLNTGDFIHFRVLSATTVLAYHYGTSALNGKKTKKTDFDNILSSFNTVLSGLGESEISSSGTTADVYTYLKAMYDLADKEWDDENSDLFKQSTYPELYTGTDYRGTNDNNKNLCYKAMQAWLMAMCLSELIPTSGTVGSNTNNQTSLFLNAYDLVGGSSIGLYGGYTLKGDPMIARLAAGAIYAKNHDAKASAITAARTALGGSMISASDWSGLGYTHNPDTTKSPDHPDYGSTTNETYKVPMTCCGYLVNTDEFVPGSFGPFPDSAPSGFPYDQPSNQYITSSDKFWEINNYDVDCKIDDMFTDDYIAYDETSHAFPTPSTSTQKEICQRLVEAGFIVASTDFAYFGEKKVKYLNTVNTTIDGNSVYLHRFAETSDSVADNNDVYIVKGAFPSLMSKMFSSSNQRSASATIGSNNTAVSQDATVYTRNNSMLFLEKILKIADNSRYPTISLYKRKRPNGGLGNSDKRAAHQYDKRGGFECGSLSALSATDDEYTRGLFNSWAVGEKLDDYPGDGYGNSYPSGHSAQAWTMAMYLGLMKPSDIITYMLGAYRFSVNRTVAKFHWNSDCMYGRMFGTMILPIINAMSGLSTDYNNVKAAINESAPTTGVTVNITNNSGSPLTIRKTLRFVLNNGSNTVSAAMQLASDYSSTVTIANGSTQQFAGVSLGDLGLYVGYNFATAAQVTAYNSANNRSYPSNIVIYDQNGETNTITGPTMSSSNTLLDNATYNITIGGSGGSTDAITIIVTNNSGSSVEFKNKLEFRLSSGNSVNSVCLFEQGDNTTLADGQSHTFSNISISGLSGIGSNFASSAQLALFTSELQSAYASAGTWNITSNISMYNASDGNNDGIAVNAINPSSISDSETFRGGATYNINIGSAASTVTGGSSPGTGGGSAEIIPGSSPSPTPTPGSQSNVTGGSTSYITNDYTSDITGTVTITNESANSITIADHGNGAYLWVMLYGTDPRLNEQQLPIYSGHYRIMGQLSGNSLTIGSGESKQYTVTFPHNASWDPEVCLGMNFATQSLAQSAGQGSNAAYYTGANAYTFKNIPSSCTFANNATWTLIIGSDTVGT